ncbi:hypothetical protein [Aquamicrobium zhengzhouense]|uniref:DUF2537 domain-containing protein n=1 Tax=Aquamicrobium zhengzhouense TaxID=2781738 RepID=A0ABS0SBI7_9HYPH|nr:hypothetical protein [Aquamicrobium zhengzhouense]MBI1620669.1 hypothetical protein [Aquamicrobium zhengzhouense]
MTDDFEKSAIFIIVVFGALTIGGLMAANLVYGQRTGVLFALGSSTCAWVAGYAMIYNKPSAFRWLLAGACLFGVASVLYLIR